MYEERVYHGIGPVWDDDDEYQAGRIFVEPPAEGPTGRENLVVLYELTPEDNGDFGWGYDGGGPGRAAAAVLADVLELGPVKDSGIRLDARPTTELVDLREAFCTDVLKHCCDDWRLTRGAVLRWARGWYLQQQITDLPARLTDLPPVPEF